MSIDRIYVINDAFVKGEEGKLLFTEFCEDHVPANIKCEFYPFDPDTSMADQVRDAVKACFDWKPSLVLLDVYFGDVGERGDRLGLTVALPAIVDAEIPVIVLSALEFTHEDAVMNVTEASRHKLVKYLSGDSLEHLHEYIFSFNHVDAQDRASETFGFRYRLGEEIKCRKRCEDVFVRLAEDYDSEPVELPLAAPVGNFLGPCPKPLPEKHSNRLFSTVTSDGRAMAVRYEGTALTAKLVAETANADPDWSAARYHYVQEMVRVETTAELDRSHFRAFYQAGLEAFSRDRVEHRKHVADVVEFTLRFLKRLDFKPLLRMSHVSLIPKLLDEMEAEGFQRKRIIKALEEFEDPEHVGRDLKIFRVPSEQYELFMKLAESRRIPLRDGIDVLAGIGDRFADARRDLGDMLEDLESRGIVGQCLFDPGIYRSLDFYSGVTMQGDIPGQEECLGGGDYSGLVEAFGAAPRIHAFGMAVGVDRIVNVILEQGGQE